VCMKRDIEPHVLKPFGIVDHTGSATLQGTCVPTCRDTAAFPVPHISGMLDNRSIQDDTRACSVPGAGNSGTGIGGQGNNFDRDLGGAFFIKAELFRGTGTQVDDPVMGKRATVINPYHN
jgi:hypothetical protein